MAEGPRIIVWNEFLHELEDERVSRHYPRGIHVELAAAIEEHTGAAVETATLAEPDHGLSEERLAGCDMLVWWGHKGHERVANEVAARVQQRVLSGMGFLALHSAHYAKPFKLLMGTNCSLRWREAGERERLWNLQPSHPILAGIPERFEIEHEEMYGERFDVPPPDELLMISWFQGGEVFRSLCTWRRGHGRVIYFRPGHETYPSYFDPNVRRIVANACLWGAGGPRLDTDRSPNAAALEPLG